MSKSKEILRGAEIFTRALKDEGVEYVFGYPGGAVLHIYDALFKQDEVKHILTRHEQGAAHAADGYARATGKPGVVLVTSGPGATNVVTGIATAHAGVARLNTIRRDVPFDTVDCAFAGSGGDIRTRLGEDDRIARFVPPLASPFGKRVGALTIPAWMARGVGADAMPEGIRSEAGELRFHFGDHSFVYDRLGLRADSIRRDET